MSNSLTHLTHNTSYPNSGTEPLTSTSGCCRVKTSTHLTLTYTLHPNPGLQPEDTFSKSKYVAKCSLRFSADVGDCMYSFARLIFVLVSTQTIGDCYVAVCGLPTPNQDHAIAMCRFAVECREKFKELRCKLETKLGPDTG